MATALIIVDAQRDFLPGGSLAVTNGDEVIQPLLAAAQLADVVVASRDFHVANHSSFQAQGGPWPPHCVVGTPGAQLDPRVDAVADMIVSKGTDPALDAYSAFDRTQLAAMLRVRGVDTVWIGGLATDYCVKATAIDAAAAGFKVTVLSDAVAAVNVAHGDGDRAIGEMRGKGISFCATADLNTVALQR